MTSGVIEIGRTSFGIDREQLVNPCHNARRGAIARTEFQGFKGFSTCMRPTTGVHHVGPAHLFVSGIAVSLQNAFELSQKSFGSFPSTAQSKVEDHTATRPAILPKVSLMVLTSSIVHLHADWRLICLNVSMFD